MGLITKEVEVVLNSSNIKYFENLGYIIPRVKGRCGVTTPRGTSIVVLVKDLLQNSKTLVDVKCDGCKELLHMQYGEYFHHNHDGKYYCVHCYNSLFNTGENNPKYNYALTDEERERGRSYPEYNEFVKIVLTRDNYTCQCCGKKSLLKVHHLDGYDWCKERRTDETNGICLCEDCHKSFHMIYGYGDNTIKQFEEWSNKIIELTKSDIVILPLKRVYCFETDTIYQNAKETAKTLGIKYVNYIRRVCNLDDNEYKSINGYHFLWYDDYITMSDNEKILYLEECYKDKKSRKVICLETLEIFQTITDAANKYGNNNASLRSKIGSITRACKNIKYTAYSYHWMLYDEYLEKIKNGKNIDIYLSNKKKAIVCVNTGEIFKQIKDGAKKYQISSTVISMACNGKQKTAGKLTDGTKLQWMYYENFLKLPIEEQNKILERNKDSSQDGSFIN